MTRYDSTTSGQASGRPLEARLLGRLADMLLGEGPARVAIVVSRFNQLVTGRMLEAALETLREAGFAPDAIDVAWVPGSFELPLAADRLAATRRYVAVICLGAIIKGETSHDRHIATAVATGIEQAARRHGLPIAFGVLTCDTLEQAVARAGGPHGNKGRESAEAALEMIGFLSSIQAADQPPPSS